MAYIYANPADATTLPANDANAQIVGYSSQDGFFYRLGQSVTVLANDKITGLGFALRKDGVPDSAGFTFRIETDNAGDPSGTLYHANLTATYAAIANGAWAWRDVVFTETTITADTTIWLIAKYTSETGTVVGVYGNNGGNSFAGGVGKRYSSNSGLWTGSADWDFRLVGTPAPAIAVKNKNRSFF